jgi:hypothetical protein
LQRGVGKSTLHMLGEIKLARHDQGRHRKSGYFGQLQETLDPEKRGLYRRQRQRLRESTADRHVLATCALPVQRQAGHDAGDHCPERNRVILAAVHKPTNLILDRPPTTST